MLNFTLVSEKEKNMFKRFWLKVHSNDRFLEEVLLKENVLLKNGEQMFLVDKVMFSAYSTCSQSMRDKSSELNLIHLGLFIGWLKKEFKPSLGFLHVIDHDNCHEVELPPSLVGAFTHGKVLRVTPSIRIRRFKGKFTENTVFVTKSAGLTLGLSVIFPVPSVKNANGELHPLLHVGQYLSAESAHFRIPAKNKLFK